MTFKPMFALHKDDAGNVLAASDFRHDFQLKDWVRGLDVRAGDVLEFKEAVNRPESDEVEPLKPAFLADEPPAPAPPSPSAIDEEQPF